MKYQTTVGMCSALVAALTLLHASAEEKKQPTQEEVRHTIAVLEKRVALQEKKIKDVTDEMIRIDENLERQVNNIVEQIAAMSDSQDSGTKMIERKREVIEGLKRSAEFFAKERDRRNRELARPTELNVPKEDLAQDVAALDERIEERVAQILAVTASLAEHEDYKKYEAYQSSVYGGYRGYSSHVQGRRKTDEYRQNERETKKSVNTKKKIHQELQEGIDRLKRENKQLENKLKYATNEDEQALFRDQIAYNSEIISKREAQMLSVVSDVNPGQKKVSRKAANTFDKMLQEASVDFRSDHNRLVQLNKQRDRERSALKRLNERLDRTRPYLTAE